MVKWSRRIEGMHTILLVSIVTILLLALIIFLGWPHKIDATRKKIYSPLISRRVCICVISDLHWFLKNQQTKK